MKSYGLKHAALAGSLALNNVVWADGLAVAIIEANTLSGTRGTLAVNLASGDSIMQFNGVGLAYSPVGKAIAVVHAKQKIDEDSVDETPALAVAHIEAGAFANTHGLVTVNQASGRGNVQANGVAIAVGKEGGAVAEVDLNQALPNARLPDENQDRSKGKRRRVSLQDTAFNGAQGIVQVNQTAGSWNATTNSFALRYTAGAVP